MRSEYSPTATAYAFCLPFIASAMLAGVLPPWLIAVFAVPALLTSRGPAAAMGFLAGALVAAYPLGSLITIPIPHVLETLRHNVEAQIGTMYPEPHASLLMGLLTGDRDGLPSQVVQDFRRTGLSHILAVSGSNITIVVSLLTSLLFFLPIKRRLVPAACGVILFVLFVGPSASVVRAAIMGMIGLLAIGVERPVHPRLAILWAAAAMLAWEPSWIREDAGFQLSFLAVIGLTELTNDIKPWLRRVPETLALRDSLLATLAAQATAVPWGAAVFGSLPLLSPLSNILAAPLIAPSMLLGAVSVVAGTLWEPLGMLLAIPVWLLLQCILLPSTLIASLPFATWNPGSLTPWLAGIWYVLLVGWWVRRERRLTPAARPAAAGIPPPHR